jgi:hypothetical protein
MGMLTFNSKQEAKEYIRSKNEEGYEAYYVEIDGKYHVNILGKINNAPVDVNRIKKLDDEGSTGEHYSATSHRHARINLIQGATKRTEYHEIGHHRLGHDSRQDKPNQIINKELDAEIYAYGKLNRRITAQVCSPATYSIKQEYIKTGKMTASEATKLIKEGLVKRNINVSKEEEQNIKDYFERK